MTRFGLTEVGGRGYSRRMTSHCPPGKRHRFAAAVVLLYAANLAAQIVPDAPTPPANLAEAPPPERTPAPRAERQDTADFGGPGGSRGPGYTATWYPSRPVSASGDRGFGGLPASVGMVRQNLNAGVPLLISPPDLLVLNARVGHTLFQTDAVLPDTARPFPSQLWNVNLGLLYVRKLDDGWSAGGLFGFGSSSDRPFASARELNLTAMAFLTRPAFGGRDSWRFSLFYTSAGALDFPIPGVAYQWNPSERLSVGIGIPFSLNWRPTDDWTLTASYLPLTNVNARLARKITDAWSAYAAYEWLNESYFLAGRENRVDRFIGLEQRVSGGVTRELGDRFLADAHAGYAFDRRYGEGANLFGSLRDRVDVRGGAFLGASLRMRF